MPVSSTRRRNQPQRNYKEEDPDDMSLTEDSDALESADEGDQPNRAYPYQDAQDFDMDEEDEVDEEDDEEQDDEEEEEEPAPQGRHARGSTSRRKTAAPPAKPPPAAAASSSTRSKAKPPPPPSKARSAAAAATTSSSRSRKPPVNYIEDEDEEDDDDLMDEEDEEDEDEEEEEEAAQVQQRGRDGRSQSRSQVKRREFSPLSSGDDEDQEIDMEDEEIDLEEGLEGNDEEEDIDVGMDEEDEEDEEDDEDEEEDDAEEEDEGEESTSTPSRGKGGRKGTAAASGGRQKGKGRAKGGATKGGLTEDEFSDDEDFSTPQPGMGFGGNLTKRQRSKLDGSEALSLDLLELPSAASRKRHRTEEELALKKSELSRRRKNMTAQRAEQDKIDTINRLLKKQAGKRKKGGDDEDGGAGGGGGDGGSGDGNNRRDQDSDKVRRVRHVIPPTYLRTICRVEGTTLSIPEVALDRVHTWMSESIREPVTQSTGEQGAEEASAAAETVKVHKTIEILEEPLVPLKAPKYPTPRGHCAMEGCSQTWKYRGVKSKKQVCGMEHLRILEGRASQV
ncbi:hypothetical protein BGZ73_001811 [Actinomortierella ambigua]|nr:hypothetical protein BGZ73_001811 [Actinomortierella ambigua]